jgi:hypothetical protein
MRCEDVDSRLRAPAEPIRIITQFDDTRHYALTIARNAIAVHVASKRHKAELRQTLCAPSGMVVEAGPSMDDQDPRTLIVSRVIPGEQTGEGSLLVTVAYGLRVHDHASLQTILSQD